MFEECDGLGLALHRDEEARELELRGRRRGRRRRITSRSKQAFRRPVLAAQSLDAAGEETQLGTSALHRKPRGDCSARKP